MPEFPDRRNVLVPRCTRCPALVNSRERISWGNGPLNAAVMVIGEAPAAGDPEADRWRGGNLTGMAYTSRHSGRRVRELFDALGYEPYVTNSVKCFPRDPDSPAETPTNREPTPEERRRCGRHLRTEIRQIDPEVVVATGKHATASVLALEDEGLDGFLDLVLEPVECSGLGVTLVPILHPSYQEIWLNRLGYSSGEYQTILRRLLDKLATGSLRFP